MIQTLILNFLKNNWKKLLIGFVLFLILIYTIIGIKSCFKPAPPVIPEDKLQAIKEVNDAERKKVIQDLIETNQERIYTVNERTTIAEVNTVERSRAVDEKVAQVNQKIKEAQQQGGDVTSEELECILTKVCP